MGDARHIALNKLGGGGGGGGGALLSLYFIIKFRYCGNLDNLVMLH